MNFESIERPRYLRITNGNEKRSVYTFEGSRTPTEFLLQDDLLMPNPDSRFTPFLQMVFKGITEADERNDFANVEPVPVNMRQDGKFEVLAAL